VVYLDAMQVAIRDQQVVRKKAVYVAVGVTLEGERDCLGLWIEKSEGARFWTSVLTELRNRGVTDILFVCTDGLSGFPEAIDAVFPEAVNQTCVVHLVRQSLRYLSYRERKSCAGELRRLYTAADADQARNPTRQVQLAHLLQLDNRNGRPPHPLRRPHPRQHLTTTDTQKNAQALESPTTSGAGCCAARPARSASSWASAGSTAFGSP